ncbi:MAG: hydantoinase B/oxoprolinase family protein [Acidimicrobiia bacterium]|nr:hydantoinase B/oxoprolinase family protein [Acidimicrobiia bacterium]
MSTQPGWQFWIDRGGTFTDIVARRPEGSTVTHKLLSDNPRRYDDAPIQGIRDLIGVADGEPLPWRSIDSVKMGTTVATNALLERAGEPMVFVTTRGFGDALRIGYQARPDIFALDIVLPEMLYQRVIEVDERMSADGKALIPLDETGSRAALAAARADGFNSVAICLLHGYRHTDHEARLGAIARDLGFRQVSVSHEVSPLMKLVSRGDTTVVDAYLSPVLRRYVEHVDARLRPEATSRESAGGAFEGPRLFFMQSSGGLTDAHAFQGKDALLSGPAGGVVGMIATAEAAGFGRLIGFDMGGTSTDVSHYSGELERTHETEVAGVRVRAPMIDIHTVAAGGGSILHFDGARMRVGPDSAGADPGPAAYRNGGPPAVTDCNVLLGKLQPDFFPPVFGPDGDQPLDAAVVRRRFGDLADEIGAATDEPTTPEQVAEGFLAIAVENMANAIKKISVQRGHDVTDHTLVCFGGAGGQHACLVADRLGITRIHIHPCAGVLSALGIGLADIRHVEDQAVELELTQDTLTTLKPHWNSLTETATNALLDQGSPPERISTHRRLALRYKGSDTALQVDDATHQQIVESFESVHRARFGFTAPNKPLIIESIQVETVGREHGAHRTTGGGAGSEPFTVRSARRPTERPVPTPLWRSAFFSGTAVETPFHHRGQLPVASQIDGPAVILEDTATTVIEPGWRATVNDLGDLVLERVEARPDQAGVDTAVDPVQLEIFNNLFMNIAEQMGLVLENTASSVNIKERLDFSCAVFDPDGDLIANAPHMPVHLGSMSESIKSIARQNPDMAPGEVYVMNAPYNGGTHLPDITVVKPVFDEGAPPGAKPIFFVAARGHHADIGGTVPGSAPADSTTVDEEGVLLDNVLLVRNDRFLHDKIHHLLTSAPYPARNPAQNIADLQAQVAACEKGAAELRRVIDHYGLDVVHAYMGHVKDNAEESVRRVIDALADGSFTCRMDDGFGVTVAITVDPDSRSAVVDFTGTSGVHPGNFNAPSAVAHAAVLYVFRSLVADDIPLNAGCMKPIEVILPDDSMINPRHPAAVIAGNVETSQVIVDTLYGALGVMGAAQGTMNNFIWGNERHQYYETICGGAGATAQADGCSAVHTHMTNSRLTDPEVLEWRFPVVLETFHVRRGSGGRGHHRGGDGVVRRVRFNEPMEVNVLSGRRKVPPYGAAGGEPGAVGHNRKIASDGTVTEFGATLQTTVDSGDRFEIETPGGGGFGPSDADSGGGDG